MKAPGRYNKAEHHREYGFVNWLRSKKWKGVDPNALLRGYMEHLKEDVAALAQRWGKSDRQAMLIRIGHDWQHFTQFAAKWYAERQKQPAA